ncbi:unnamed protein product [Didymodactylos carnosus]|uniref:ACB domain-containing protein n=1 Tax=Didymodactylos carnosus TaxID=1234261 RepID=A0A814LH84_9BILA|nr:unnamed protein product [Didymodactylos carnosus]CAF3832516.1 unnamed protein product [Didymodactylos carnosus]
MSIYYDEILAGNCFGQINVTTPTSIRNTAQAGASSTKMTNDADSSLVDKKYEQTMENNSITNGKYTVLDDLGFSTTDLYTLARQFLKEKEGTKALHLGYKDKQRLVALSKQVAFGQYQPQSGEQIGFLDVIGNDRRQAWIELGNMSTDMAMNEFIKLLSQQCSMFRPYLEAHRRDNEEKERLSC